MDLPVTLQNKIVEFLTSLPGIDDNDSQRSFIYSAGLDPQLQKQIRFGTPCTQFFQLLIPILTNYGELNDGRNSIEAILEVSKNLVGQEKKKYCENLIQKLQPHTERDDDTLKKVFLAKLPTTGSELLGREEELALLDTAWTCPQTNLVSIIAWGGVGKTALVNEWLNRMSVKNYPGAKRIYGWSFYSQGTQEERQISADEFITHALMWFGDTDPTSGTPWEKGERLANLIRQAPTLLILDGMEPLQYPPGAMQGQLKDRGLQALLKELARFQPGLCIIATRVAVKDLDHLLTSSVKRLRLEHLRIEVGAELLKLLGVDGTLAELQKTAQEFKGHALALNLLGKYIAIAHDGDIRKRDMVPHLTEEEEQGGHARRVMESYEHWLSASPELNILYLLGLFDRPAAGGAIDILKSKPPIAGLTTELQHIAPHKWNYAVNRLRDLRLLAEKNANNPNTLDCHPLIREHFGGKLRRNNPHAWKEAHSRLYDYYKGRSKEYPENLRDMEPLFIAVAHGCQTGRCLEAFYDVYWKRISREKHFIKHKLGAFGADLSILSNFFEETWSRTIMGLNDEAKACILNSAGFNLRALGRLQEAIQPFKAAIDIVISRENWTNAASGLGTLSELYLSLGEVRQAVECAQQGVDFADRSNENFRKKTERVILADALHQAGSLREARAIFHEAERIQQELEQGYSLLYFQNGFQYCDLLLSLGEYQEVQNRANQTLNRAQTKLDVALDNLSLGRALILQFRKGKPEDRASAKKYLVQAVADLRESGRQDISPLGLLALAAFYRVAKEFSNAWKVLEEMYEIVEQGSMRLYLADYHIEVCHLCLLEGKLIDAQHHFAIAKEMVNTMAYHRRDKEIEGLAEMLNVKE